MTPQRHQTGGENMETRLTLRINEELDKLLEARKKETGLSKNQLIVKACEQFIDEYKRQQKG